jgi:hypothetical protein
VTVEAQRFQCSVVEPEHSACRAEERVDHAGSVSSSHAIAAAISGRGNVDREAVMSVAILSR